MHDDDLIDALIEKFLDDELTPTETARLHAHVADCPACARELALAARIQSELRSLSPAEAPLPVPSHPLRWLAAAAVLVLALAGVLALHRERSQTPAGAPPANTASTAAQPSPEEVARAAAEARFALAYVGKVSRQTGLSLRSGVLRNRTPLTESDEP